MGIGNGFSLFYQYATIAFTYLPHAKIFGPSTSLRLSNLRSTCEMLQGTEQNDVPGGGKDAPRILVPCHPGSVTGKQHSCPNAREESDILDSRRELTGCWALSLRSCNLGSSCPLMLWLHGLGSLLASNIVDWWSMQPPRIWPSLSLLQSSSLSHSFAKSQGFVVLNL